MNEGPIRTGSIVVVHTIFSDTHSFVPPKAKHIGIVVKENVYNPGGMKVSVPGKGTLDFPTEQCYNATEEQRKEYFLAKLTYGE